MKMNKKVKKIPWYNTTFHYSLCFLLLFFLFLNPPFARAIDYYVETPANNGNDGNPGTSWATAKATIQAAINLATSPGDRVLVAEGTYNENIHFPAHDNFQLLGGYPSSGGEHSPWSHSTIIDGTGLSGSVVYIPGNMDPMNQRSYTQLGIDGFTIQNGNKNTGYGAGIESWSIDLSIKRCLIQNNTASANTYVGGIFAGSLLGDSSNSTLQIDGSIIRNNTGVRGGGIIVDSIGYPTITMTNTVVSNNNATATNYSYSVGGITLGTGDQNIASCTITNCTIANNSSVHPTNAVGGIGINLNYSPGVIKVINSVIWNNNDDIYDYTAGGANIQVSYSDIHDVDTGTAVIHTDPSFVGSNDYHLTGNSGDCIDGGTANGAPGIDLEGIVRPQGNGYEMGAYEYNVVLQYTLDTNVVGGHGTLLPANRDYAEGEVVTLTATPDFGFQVVEWSGTDDDTSSSSVNSVTMNGNKTVTVQFEISSAFTGDIGTIQWQRIFNSNTNPYYQAFFNSVIFNADNSLLVSGYRGEPDSKSAIALRYDSDTGSIRDTPSEWFLFEYTWGDYTHDRFYGQFIDSSNNTYFVGVSYGENFNTFTNRYNCPNIWKFDSSYTNPDPNTLRPSRPSWRKYHCDSGHPENQGEFNDLAVDSAGNIYTAGWFDNLESTTSDRDWIVDKYDSDGTEAEGFPLIFNKADLQDYATSIAIDSEDNFIVVGSVMVNSASPQYNWVVHKYDSTGALLWQTEYDYGLNGLHEQALFVVVDDQDNIIVCGYRTNNTTENDRDWYIVKYAKNGNGSGGATVLWEQFWDDGLNKHGLARGMLLDHQQNIYVIGRQAQDSINPAYSNRFKPVLQYRDGLTGNLLKLQNIPLLPTHNHSWSIEHDFMYRLAQKNGKLVIVGGTVEDANYLIPFSRTGRVVMLELFFSITPSSSANGTISPAEEVKQITYDSTRQFILTPAPGYRPGIPKGSCPKGNLLDNDDGSWTYTTGHITFDCTLVANFTNSFPWPIFMPAMMSMGQ
jgi:hypothetical protein